MNARLSRYALALVLTLSALTPGCGDDASGDPQQAAVLQGVKADITADLVELTAAAEALRAAIPAPDADGWNDQSDAQSVAAMRAAWVRARNAYERIEGAIAVLFPDLDAATDERYDGFLAELPGMRDTNLFDGGGVTGVHGIERILWANSHPARVVAFESRLTGYVAAAFPRNMAEATAFRDGLVTRFVTDCRAMQTQFAPLALDTSAAFRGVIGSLEEQQEKVELAASAEEESRYAQFTLGDMRANLAGGLRTWQRFRPWVVARGGAELAGRIDQRFAALQTGYSMLQGDAIPAVPEGYNPDSPSAEHQMSPYHRLRDGIAREADPANPAGLVAEMNRAADLLAIPRLPE